LYIALFKAPWVISDAVEPSGTVREIGTLLLTDYLLPFEVISVLLLGALIGAAVLSREDT
jgi:NADH-quinone oxidoreductase subunit J